MNEILPCPSCGKPMEEQPKFPGLFLCPDNKGETRTCNGIHLTDEGAEAFEAELMRLSLQELRSKN